MNTLALVEMHRPVAVTGGVTVCATCRGKLGYRRPWPTETDKMIHEMVAPREYARLLREAEDRRLLHNSEMQG